MIKHEELLSKNCPIYRNLDLIGKRWTLFILLEFNKNLNAQIKFSQLKKKLSPITSRALSLKLTQLVQEKILDKESSSDIDTNYTLTKKGEELLELLILLNKWNEKYENCEFENTCKRCIK